MSDIDLWDREAETFDEAADHGLADPACREAWRSLLLEHLPPAPATIADLGCGTGTLSLLLAGEGYAVDGVDFSPEMVRRAQAKAGDVARFVEGDAAAPPLEPASYDVVLSRHVLWAMPSPAEALAALDRAAAAGRPAAAGRGQLVDGRGPERRADRRPGPGDRARGRAAPDAGAGLLGPRDHRRPLPGRRAPLDM